MRPYLTRLASVAALSLVSACSWWFAPSPDGEVRAFLGDSLTTMLENPDRVTLRSKSQKEPLPLAAGAVEDLQAMIFDWGSYVPQVQKKCKFRPDAAFDFAKGDKRIEVAIDQKCKIWRFSEEGKTLFEDFDPAAPEMSRLLKTLLEKKE
jgi:hypothetical protein